MGEREPTMEKREVRLPDGRRLVFYRFPEPPPAPGQERPRDPAPPAGGGER
jgi:hypothetical protein